MEFKIGKTCSGCENIVKNLNKIGANGKATDKIEDTIGGEIAKADVGKFLAKTSADAGKVSKELVKKMNDNAKPKAPKFAKIK
jgi:hypothetical protein